MRMPQELLQHKPGMRASLADAAVSGYLIFSFDPLAFVQLSQVRCWLESAVILLGFRLDLVFGEIRWNCNRVVSGRMESVHEGYL